MDVYSLSRSFWDFAFENPDKVRTGHIALYFFSIEHCNRLGWKEKFGLPTTMTMEAIGIKSYHTYIKLFNDLVDFGFYELHQKSKNQYSSNVIALSKNAKANIKALDKAITKHVSKQQQSTIQSTYQSNDSINIQYTNIPITPTVAENGSNTLDEEKKIEEVKEVFASVLKSQLWMETTCMKNRRDEFEVTKHFHNFYYHFISIDGHKKEKFDESSIKKHFNNWINKGNPIPQIPEHQRRKKQVNME